MKKDPILDVPTLLDCCKEYRAQLSEAQECLKDAIELAMHRVLLNADEFVKIRRWRKAAGVKYEPQKPKKRNKHST